MQIHEYYMQLHQLREHSNTAQDGSYAVTIEQLAKLFHCTPRNVKLVLRKLEQQQYIRWQPGRGRGNPSRLALIGEPADVVLPVLHSLLLESRFKDAFALASDASLPLSVKQMAQSTIARQLGLRVETTSGAPLDVLRVMQNRELKSLNPHAVFTVFEAYLIDNICSTLVEYEPDVQRFVPRLAHAWEHNGDYTSWTFYLRKKVSFHHGHELTSKDVRSTWERLRDALPGPYTESQYVKNVQLHGDYAVEFRFHRSNRFWLHFAGSIQMSILPSDWMPGESRLIGTGPYRIAEQDKQMLRLDAFDGYYGLRPLLDRVELWFLPDVYTNERHYMLPDTRTPGPGTSLETPGKQAERVHWPQTTELQRTMLPIAHGARYLLFNFNRPGIQHNRAFRQVIRMLYDQKALVSQLRKNTMRPADSFLPEVSETAPFPTYSSDEASRLLQQSGYDGQEIRLFFLAKEEETTEAEWLRQRCADIGIHLSLHPMQQVDSSWIQREADIMQADELLEKDLQWGMFSFFMNRSNYIHHLLDAEQLHQLGTILEGFVQQGEQERWNILLRAEQLLKENFWLLHGSHTHKKNHLHPALQGLQMDSFGLIDLSQVWIKHGAARHERSGPGDSRPFA